MDFSKMSKIFKIDKKLLSYVKKNSIVFLFTLNPIKATSVSGQSYWTTCFFVFYHVVI